MKDLILILSVFPTIPVCRVFTTSVLSLDVTRRSLKRMNGWYDIMENPSYSLKLLLSNENYSIFGMSTFNHQSERFANRYPCLNLNRHYCCVLFVPTFSPKTIIRLLIHVILKKCETVHVFQETLKMPSISLKDSVSDGTLSL